MYHQEIPIHNHTPPDHNRQLGKSQTAKRYIDRVHDTLTSRVSQFICAIVFSLLFIVGVILFVLWLSLSPHRPRFHLRDFSITGFDQVDGSEGAQVIFNVTVRNSNQNVGYYYDAMQVVLSYQDQVIGSTNLSSPFFQETKNTTILYGVLINGKTLTINNRRWMQFQADRVQGVVIFRLDFTTAIRFKVSSWKSRWHKVHANCEIGVGPDGMVLASYKDKKFRVYFS